MKVTNHGSGPEPIFAYALLMLLKQPERYVLTALSFRGHTSESQLLALCVIQHRLALGRLDSRLSGPRHLHR